MKPNNPEKLGDLLTKEEKVVDLISTTKPPFEPTSENALPTEVPAPTKDEFADPKFVDPFARLPRIQALRGTLPKQCGYFVSVSEMARAGWVGDFDESQLTTYTFESSGQEEEGILIPNPRMLVCPKTPCLGFDKELTKQSKYPAILGRYSEEYKENENIGNTQYFQVFLLDDQNRPLHQIPLSYRASGANQATFSIHWQQFCQELTACHAIANHIAAKPKNNLFLSLGIFAFKTAREQVGQKQKSFACRVVEHEKPTLENWKQYFIGFSAELKEWVWEALEPDKPLIIPGTSDAPMLPGTPNQSTQALEPSS